MATMGEFEEKESGIVHATNAAQYWAGTAEDLGRIRWCHATNDQDRLSTALADDHIHMIEADVSLGISSSAVDDGEVPIMAHPPQTRSNLSLDTFLAQVAQLLSGNTKKGIKLDFKSDQVLEKALMTVGSWQSQLPCPIWLNADILPGPGGPSSRPVDAGLFLGLCQRHCPAATISPGFTTGPHHESLGYSTRQVEAMLAVLAPFQWHSVTFPVRALFLGQSVSALTTLLDGVGAATNATLTVWGSDKLSPTQRAAVKSAINTIGKNRVYLDVAPDLYQELIA